MAYAKSVLITMELNLATFFKSMSNPGGRLIGEEQCIHCSFFCFFILFDRFVFCLYFHDMNILLLCKFLGTKRANQRLARYVKSIV
jgi:hypothetical protein